MTTVEAVIRMAGKNMGDYLDEPLENILSTPEVTHVFENIKLGVAVPTPPVLIVQAVHDYLIDVKDIDVLADAYSPAAPRSPTTGMRSTSTCCYTRCPLR